MTVRCESAYTSCFLPSGHPTPNLIPNQKNPNPLPLGRVTGQKSFMQDHNNLSRLKTAFRTRKAFPSRWEYFCQWWTWRKQQQKSCRAWLIEMEIFVGAPPLNTLSHLHLFTDGLSQRPMKLNAGVSAGQCRPESIYLHTSTGLVEERLSASDILVSLKSLLSQTWLNGLLMDIQRQVLFLLAGALDKKLKADLKL